MRRMLINALALLTGLAAWAGSAKAGFFSVTGPIIAIVAGDLFQGEAEGYIDGSGTFGIQSRSNPGLSCNGQFSTSADLGGTGHMRCSNDATATFQFKRLSLRRGHGTGTGTLGTMSFTYGLSANESRPYLIVPPGKALVSDGKYPVLMDLKQSGAIAQSMAPAATPLENSPQPDPAALSIPSTAQSAPDMLLKTATLVVAGNLRPDKTPPSFAPGKIAALVESTVLPLFDFRHMTRLALARSWRLASNEQQNAIVAEFRSLMAHTYSTALSNYGDQAIEYKPLRMASGETTVTVKSTVRPQGAEPMAIDYDMEKTPAGWKIYDIKIAGVSLLSTYRSTFTEVVRDAGIDGLIDTLVARNRQIDAGLASTENGARYFLFMYSVMPHVIHRIQ